MEKNNKIASIIEIVDKSTLCIPFFVAIMRIFNDFLLIKKKKKTLKSTESS